MGSPVVHFELWSKNPEQAAAFYKNVFDWEIDFLPEMNYRMVKTGGAGGINGGIMQPQDGPIPAPTSLYIAVDDLAAYGKRITAAGGQVIVDQQDVPGMGSFSLFADPDGRVMGIWKQS